QNGVHEEPEWLLAHVDDFGTARCENHFNVGWAWALDAPFQWMKQVASHFGGTRNGMAISWPRRITDAGALRTQFHHVVDIAPTISAGGGSDPRVRVHGFFQCPLDGVSMDYTFDADGPSTRTTQYFEILGNRAIYHDGWVAACFHGRLPWIRLQGYEFDGPQEVWELYDVRTDFSQAVDLAAEHPEILAELQRVFHEEAARHGVYPLRDVASPRHGDHAVPAPLGGLARMTYTTAHVRMPESSVVNLKNCSWRITAEITTVDAPEGVVACQGGNMAGWSLYVDDSGHAAYHYSWLGHEHYVIVAQDALSPGRHEVVLEFAYEGGMGGGGDAVLSVDGRPVGAVHKNHTVPVIFSISGETFDVGMDTGVPVGDYPMINRFTGAIHGVTLE
ncbi:MAG: arylsulfatase, partial [Actinomycetota bacterium]